MRLENGKWVNDQYPSHSIDKLLQYFTPRVQVINLEKVSFVHQFDWLFYTAVQVRKFKKYKFSDPKVCLY